MAMTWKEIETHVRNSESALYNSRSFLQPLKDELGATKRLLDELSTVIGPNAWHYHEPKKRWTEKIAENIRRIEALLGP